MAALLAFGPFAFGMQTANFDKLQRQMQFKHAAAVRIGARNAYQIVGPGDETLTLSGVVAPEVTGTLASISELEDMGREGLSYVLVDGTGYVYGTYYIDSLQTDHSYHMKDGTPRKVEFTLSLIRSDDLPTDKAPTTKTVAS